MIGNGNIIANAVSRFGAVVGLDIENAKVFEEIVFSVSKRLVFPSSSVGGGILDIVIDTTCSCDVLVFLPVVFKAFGAGPIFIDLYIGTDADEDGTIIESGNRDNNSANAAQVTSRLNPTINNVGTKAPFEFVILSNGTAAISMAGGEAKEGQVTSVIKNTKYMFRCATQEANSAFGYFGSTWFEEP